MAAAEPVVIVGGGPSGLVSALLLARHGIDTIVLERMAHETSAPRAHVVNPRSLEIFRAAELDVERMQREATGDDDRWCVYAATLTGPEIGRSPFEWQDDAHTPLPRINLAQPLLERILLDAVDGEPRIDFRPGHRWQSAEEMLDAVVSTVSSADGSTYTVAGPYLLGADGANSRVRESLGFEMEGPADVMRCLTIHFEANLRDLVRDRPAMFYWTLHPTIPGIFIAYNIEKTWVYLSFAAPPTTPTDEQAREQLLEAIGRRDVDLTVHHVIPWSLVGQVANRYNTNRIFLLGDACHRFPPAGGLGMNTGIQDAHNLAWKLAAVINKWADPPLLSTYESERRPIALHNTEQALTNSQGIPAVSVLTGESPPDEVEAAIDGMFDNFNSLRMQIGFTYSGKPNEGEVSMYQPSADIGDRMPHAWITQPNRGRISTLDLLDDRSYTVLTCSSTAEWTPSSSRIPLTVVRIDPGWDVPRDWLDVMGLLDEHTAVLVRPDGHIEDRVSGDGALGLPLSTPDDV